ncbi:Transcription factor Pcc1 [uncultured archaeon]|nr:Transcription factor Pcc1 [uncultured archaeon]
MNTLSVEARMNPASATAIARSLSIESASKGYDKSSVDVSVEKDVLRLTVCAEDLHTLRASASTYLRWLKMAKDLVSNEDT